MGCGRAEIRIIWAFKAADIDCDATAILLKNGKFTDKNDVVYFGNLTHGLERCPSYGR